MAWFVAFLGSITGFLFGYDEGIIAGSLPLVQDYFKLSEMHAGIVASALPFGALIGSILIGMMLASRYARKKGRRTILFLVGFLFFFGAVGTSSAQSEYFLICSRLILGVAIGMAAVTTPLYLAETAPKEARGAMVSMYQLAITAGIVSAYVVNYSLIAKHTWRLMFASSSIPALILMFGIFFLPESPRWLVSVGRMDEAMGALRRLRKQGATHHELQEIETTLASEPKGNQWRLLFQKPLRPVLILGMMLFCLQQLSGINVIIYFAPEIFRNLGFASSMGQLLATIGVGVVNFLVTILAIFYMDKLGRRKLLLLGFLGTGISLSALSVFSYYQVSALPYLSLLCLSLYIFSFAISIGPIPHLAMSEIFPLHVRGFGMGLSSVSNWGFNTLTVLSFPIFVHQLGIEFTFAAYGFICFLGYIYTYYFMPETKNLSLEAIENYLVRGHALRRLGRLPEKKQIPIGSKDSEWDVSI